MEHSAKEILDMARKTLGEEIQPEETPVEVTEFTRPLADYIVEDDELVNAETGEVMEALPEVVEQELVLENQELVIEGMEPLQLDPEPMMPTYIPAEGSSVALYNPHSSHQIDVYQPQTLQEDLKPHIKATSFNKFTDFPEQLRDIGEGVDLYEVKRLNLAVAIESYDQAATSYASFPSADAAVAVTQLSNQVHKLTLELEKAQDPKKLAEKLETELLNRFAQDMLKAVSTEFKHFLEKSIPLIQPDKKAAYNELMLQAVNTRMGPAMQEALETNIVRLMKVLGIKEKL